MASLVQALARARFPYAVSWLGRSLLCEAEHGQAASVLVQAMQQAGDCRIPTSRAPRQLVLPLSSRSSTEALVWIDAFARLGSPRPYPLWPI